MTATIAPSPSSADLVAVPGTVEGPRGIALYAPHDTPGAMEKLLATGLVTWARARGAILSVLLAQLVLSLRFTNTAFQDEALYLYAGHREIALLLHGTPTFDNYSSYFSGSPFLYPVFAAGVDGVGGLELVRAVNLALMLAATVFVYGLTKRLFGKTPALFASIVFAVAEPTQFMGRLATYDAPALFLLAAASWITVRIAHRTPPAVVGVAPVLVLAAATKYASVLFIPTIVILSVLVAVRHRGWWQAVARGGLLLVSTAGLAGAFVYAVPQLRAGITSTTSARSQGSDSVAAVLGNSAAYVGAAFVLALVGTVVYWRSPACRSNGRPGERLWLGAVLSASALLAPLDQMHLHTLTSLQKHVGYGLLFAAPLAGVALAQLVDAHRAHHRRIGIALALCLVLTWAGVGQTQQRFHDWPGSSALVATLRSEVRPVSGHYLVEESEVPRYYLRDLTQPYQWTGTYFFAYTDHAGAHLSGIPAYRAAIAEGYFDVVALRYGPTAALDVQIDGLLRAQKGYELVEKIPTDSSFGRGAWWVWQRTS